MPGSNLEWAIAAYVHCVEALEEYGSDNKRFAAALKRRDEEDPIDLGAMEKRLKRDNALKMKLKPNQPAAGKATMDDVVAYGLKAQMEKAGNCFEHAAVAASYLHAQRDQAPVFDVVQIPTLDHAFVVIGQTRPAKGDYPMLFAEWDAGAAICDGWGRICCPARDYPVIWDRTMNVWVAGGVEVPTGGMNWGSPATYRGETERYPKQSYTAAQGSGSRCLLATAACEAAGLDEDCAELAALRGFRDAVLRPDPAGAALVARYYAAAPAALAALARSPARADLLGRVYAEGVVPAAAAISRGDRLLAAAIFRRVLAAAEAWATAGAPPTSPACGT